MALDPFSSRLARDAGHNGPLVLMYHSVTPESGTPESRWAVSAGRFREQVEFLSREGWNTACVRDLRSVDSLPPRTVVFTFDDGYEDNVPNAFETLVAFGMRATWFIATSDVGTDARWRDHDAPVLTLMSRGQIRDLAGAGMEVGAHTRTHRRLTSLDTMAIDEEVAGSKHDLEEIVGVGITSFAYPYGLFDERCVEAVRRAGYQVACSTRSGWVRSEPDPYKVRRVTVFADDDLSAFARKLAFADNDVSWPRIAKYAADRLKSRLFGGV